jgi:hypothetical protein
MQLFSADAKVQSHSLDTFHLAGPFPYPRKRYGAEEQATYLCKKKGKCMEEDAEILTERKKNETNGNFISLTALHTFISFFKKKKISS